VSKWTSKKYEYLDTPSQALSTSRVRRRTRPYEVLEIALYDWMKRMEERIAISGAILKAMALNFYNRMPHYKD
jgi:Tc5 transposase DNA-binding domain